MPQTDRHLSPAETAKRFGVSIKALRLYEQRGLLTPMRSGNGWRAYGPVQIARLHQIITLKRLGLPLAQIGELLAGADGLDDVLALQERALARDSEKLAHALGVVRAARAKLASGAALSIDDLATLNRETVMKTLTDIERMQLLKPISDKYFSKEDSDALKARKFDQPEMTAKWDALMNEAKAFIAAKADPTSPPVQDLAWRWNALIEQFTGGDQGMRGKIKAVWQEAMADPKLAPIIPVTPELWDYLTRAMRHLRGAA